MTRSLFHETDGRLIFVCCEDQRNGNPDAFCDMSRPCHKNRQNLIIDLTISVLCGNKPKLIRIDAIFENKYFKHQMLRDSSLTSK